MRPECNCDKCKSNIYPLNDLVFVVPMGLFLLILFIAILFS